MLEAHIKIFKRATTEAFSGDKTFPLACILVRDTNVNSLKYIHDSRYRPKPIECKAKTANAHGHPLAGIVVSPYLVPEAFRPGSLLNAKTEWRNFEKVMRSRSGWSIVQEGEHRGSVQYRSRYLHGDYDLFDLIPVRKSDLDSSNRLKPNIKVGHLASLDKMNGQDSFMGWGVSKLKRFVMKEIRVDMVQHGGSMQYVSDADEWEKDIHVFVPDGKQGKYKLCKDVKNEFYKTHYPMRKPLGLYARTR